MSSTFFGVTGGGGGGASSGFFLGMAYGPTLPLGPPASAGTSCFGFSVSGVWEGVCGAGVCPGWSCAHMGKEPYDKARQTTSASAGLAAGAILHGKALPFCWLNMV